MDFGVLDGFLPIYAHNASITNLHQLFLYISSKNSVIQFHHFLNVMFLGGAFVPLQALGFCKQREDAKVKVGDKAGNCSLRRVDFAVKPEQIN